MTDTKQTPRKPPKPRLPARAKGAMKEGGDSRKKRTKGRVTTAELADRIDGIGETVASIEQALSLRERSPEVDAEEHALLNLVDSIVDRRTDKVLLPLAQLATLLDRLAMLTKPEDQRDLIQESNVQLAVVLETLGLERIAPDRGDESDPWLHEEVDLVTESELEEGLVERLVRPGIRVRGGRTLVPALVAVSGKGG